MNVMFSVIVPIYRVEAYLEKCVESILCQTCTDFELILIDDGSPDRCPQICDTYASQDSRIRVIHKPNGGLVSARNVGLRIARGDYICYVDGDDWIEPEMLKTVRNRAIEPYSPDMIIFGAAKKYHDHEEIISPGLPEGFYAKDDLREKVYPFMMYDRRKPFCQGLIFPVAWNKIYRRTLLLKHFCTDERIRMGEDNAFTFECLYNAEYVAVLNNILYNYNQLNINSMVHSYDPFRFRNNCLLFDYMSSRLEGLNPVLDGQLNAFRAYWVIMAVFHEVKSGIPLGQATRHIRTEIKNTHALKNICLAGLPITARGFLILLKLHLYYCALLGAKIMNRIRM